MSGQLIGALILWLIVAIIVIAIVVYLVNWLYRRSSKEAAFVRTGLAGEKVVIDAGAFVLPFIHDITPVNMNVLQMRVHRGQGDAIITRDRMRVYEVEASTLALAAAERALECARVAPDLVTHLVTVSCSGFYAPGFDIALIKQLPLAANVPRTQVGFMGCHGALNGLRVAQAFVAADPSACALICAVELCSLHHQYGWNAEQIVANSLFADGAGAIVALWGNGPSDSLPQIVAAGSTLIAESEDAMSWRIGDHGFQMTLSARLPELIARNLCSWLNDWLGAHGLTVATVGSWAVHPGGPRILAAVGESLGIDRWALDLSHGVLAEFGNMSSPTVLFILERLRQTKAPRPWVALGFGPGLAVEAVLLA